MRLVVGISGASGALLGVEVLRALRAHDCEVHLVVSPGAATTLALEGAGTMAAVAALADRVYEPTDMAATIASGSFRTDGMLVVPCSMKTLAAIVHGFADNLLVRAADVCLKERRPLVLCPREMPLGQVHLRNLLAAAQLGCVIVPPMLSFYQRPETVQDQIDHVVGKLLMQIGLQHAPFRAWAGGAVGADG